MMNRSRHPLPRSFLSVPITHRTLHDIDEGRPENSIEGAQAAIDHGYGIEIDLQLSKDGVAMVFHDYELDRLTSKTGLLSDRTAKELTSIALSGGQAGIPTFAKFLELVSGQVPILVELKAQNHEYKTEQPDMALSCKEAVENYEGDIAFMSFNPHMIAQFQKHLPQYPRGLTTDPFAKSDWPDVSNNDREDMAQMTMFEDTGCSFISHNVNDLDSEVITTRKLSGDDVLCWTVKSLNQEIQARQVAQNITFEQYYAAGGNRG